MPTVAELLAFEDTHRGHTPRKEEIIRRELGVTAARYYVLLARAIETSEALELDPMLVHALFRDRARRRAERERRAHILPTTSISGGVRA